MGVESEKRLAAEAAAELVESGMTVGLGSGSTVAVLIPVLARRRLSIRCVAASPETARLATSLGIRVEPFDRLPRLDLGIDGADQITREGWLMKGKGGAHTREKIVAASCDRWVVIADSTKVVSSLQTPVPLELLSFGLSATLQRLEPVILRSAPLSPDGGVIADFHGAMRDPASLSAWLKGVPGVVEHGLFPPELVADGFVARGHSVEHLIFKPG
jgi:ribose 5-phosphate isomerase A